jgi:hypothetical protein
MGTITVMTTIMLSDKVAAIAQARAAEEGFASVAHYLEALLLDEAQYTTGAPEHLTAQTHEQLVALVREGLASPAHEMASTDFAQMRAVLAARYAKPKAG